MKNILEYLDKEGIKYTLYSNPTPERIEEIKKLIFKRDEKIKQIQEDYKSGKFKDVI